MSSKRTINLLVLRADVDPAGNEAFQLARKHDPDGARTLGVLTCTMRLIACTRRRSRYGL
jgi:hypothetical protein